MKRSPTAIVPSSRRLTAEAFHGLAAVPPEMEWFANLGNKAHAVPTSTPCRTSCASPA